ncbi:MAG: hypothetical protein M3198_03035, partial [Actinomycetota bacterium]|nr:hypothetical protein [Actinomycetota bacterium]
NEDGVPYPESVLLRDEARFLQERNGRVEHPTVGPVQTKDAMDALQEVCLSALGADSDQKVFEALSSTPPSGRPWTLLDPATQAVYDAFSASSRRGRRRSPRPPESGGRFDP